MPVAGSGEPSAGRTLSAHNARTLASGWGVPEPEPSGEPLDAGIGEPSAGSGVSGDSHSARTSALDRRGTSARGVSEASAELTVSCMVSGIGNRSGAVLGGHDAGARDVGVASAGKRTSARFTGSGGTSSGTRSESSDGLDTEADLARDGRVVDRVGDVGDVDTRTGVGAPPILGLQLGNVARQLHRQRGLCQAEARLTPRDLWGKFLRPPSLAGSARGGAAGARVLLSVATATEEILQHSRWTFGAHESYTAGDATGGGLDPAAASAA